MDQASTSFKEIIQKKVNAKANASLKFSAIVWNLDAHYFKGNCLSYNTFSKMQTQGFKDSSYFKESKPKNLKLILSYNNIAKLIKKDNNKKRS